MNVGALADGLGRRRYGAGAVHVRPVGRQEDALLLVQSSYGRQRHVYRDLDHLPRPVRPLRHGLPRLRLQSRKVVASMLNRRKELKFLHYGSNATCTPHTRTTQAHKFSATGQPVCAVSATLKAEARRRRHGRSLFRGSYVYDRSRGDCRLTMSVPGLEVWLGGFSQ